MYYNIDKHALSLHTHIHNDMDFPIDLCIYSLYCQMVTDHLMKTYKELKSIASQEINYHRYRQEIRIIHQAPCVPHLGVCVCVNH